MEREQTLNSDSGMQFRAFFNESSPSIPEQLPEEPIFTGYLSDLPSEDTHEASDDDADDESIESVQPPPKKRHAFSNRKHGLKDIEKLIASKRTKFDAGHNSLQAYRARAVQSLLQMGVNNKQKFIEASEMAAESQGFAAKWGGRLV
ncbi:hypothetical protein C8J57DRAFT_1226108 [Mycena rebaudengoi]|nr:hypothetical protein C8J57DRAFT_1226108 [Mycena rebaudengoi]